MKWFEITVTTCREFADFVSLALIEQGSEGTVIRDSADIKDLLSSNIIWDYVDEKLLSDIDPRVFVSGFFHSMSDISTATEAICQLKSDFETETGSLETAVKEIDSEDWENEWKKYYMPIELSSFAIVPEWIDKHGIGGKKIIRLNPGMAFGTGSHETTYMCLQLLDEEQLNDKTVIDVGCGSGILGITAYILGARECILTDIDPYAVKCAKDNAKLNSIENDIEIITADLLKGEVKKLADVVTANLTAPLLLLLKDGIKKHLSKGATIIISGILKDYNQDVLDSYLTDFTLEKSLQSGSWCAHKLKLK